MSILPAHENVEFAALEQPMGTQGSGRRRMSILPAHENMEFKTFVQPMAKGPKVADGAA